MELRETDTDGNVCTNMCPLHEAFISVIQANGKNLIHAQSYTEEVVTIVIRQPDTERTGGRNRMLWHCQSR